MEVLDHGFEVEAPELLGVVERLAHRIGQAGALVQHLKVQLVRPPVSVRIGAGSARHRALAFICHASLQSCLVVGSTEARSGRIFKQHAACYGANARSSSRAASPNSCSTFIPCASFIFSCSSWMVLF